MLNHEKIKNIKKQYIRNDIVMTEFLRNFNVTRQEKETLLKWSGEEKYCND